MDRSVHVVGTVPADTARDAMRMVLDVPGLAPHLRTLPDGETGPRQWWVKAELDGIQAGIPGLTIVNPDAGYTSPQDATWFQVPAGRTLRAAEVERCLPTLTAFQASYPEFRRLREERHLGSGLKFQVGLPAPMDLGWCAFSPDAGLQPDILQPILEAKAALIRACAAQAGQDVVFQLDIPIATIMVATAPEDERAKVAAWAAGLIAEVPALTPPGTRIGLHLCWGDMNHQSMVQPDSAEPLVLLVNELASQWPGLVEWFHVPVAFAADPPRPDEAWYQPFRDLAVPPGTRLAAGFVHETLSPGQHWRLLEMIDRNMGRAVDISTACGLGRRPDPRQVHHALETCALLAAG